LIFFPNVREGKKKFLKQDGVSNDPETFSYVMKIYESACAHTKTSQIT
jgi:hypothetical protein